MIKIKYMIQFPILIILIILANLGLKDDFIPFMQWWLVLLLLGLIFLPLTQKIFSSYHDNGYLFSKTIGIAISGYLMWLASSIRIMKFSSLSCVIIVNLCLSVNLLIFFKSKKEEKKSIIAPEKISSILTEEILFLAVFLIWTYIRGFKPEAYGTEKFMDYGFMTSMMRAEYMPPQDLWFAGRSINYYYVGQYMATFMTKLSSVSVNVGYNLMLMTLAAFTFVLPYSLVLNVTRNYLDNPNKKHKKAPTIAGLLSGAGVCLAGNIHFTLYYWIIPIIRTILGNEGEYSSFWFPDSTRFIGYNPETTDKTIHEFPSYSFVLGDLHAHVINIMFVITVLGILYAWLLHRRKQMEDFLDHTSSDETKLYREIYNPYIIMIGFFIGLFHTTNFWDFPIYYVVSGAIILFSNGVVYQFKRKTIWITAIQGLVIIAVAKLIALPFTLNFDQISTEICLTVARTPIYQLIILWGLPSLLVIGLLAELISKFKLKKDDIVISEEVTKKKKILFKIGQSFLANLHVSDLFILTIGLCAIGLILIPEIIYVKDIYSGDYKRANTMFKLTYQAFILFGISSGYIFVKLLKDNRWKRKFAIITLLFFLSSLWYSRVAILAWYGNIFNTQNYKGLDAAAFLEIVMPDDYLATNWLNDNIVGSPVVLEANGDSYSDYERVSVVTGLPTVLGWYVHEWLWRGNNDIVDERAADVQTIYTSMDEEQVITLLDEYNVEYIYVGKLEMDKYATVNHSLLKGLGEVVYSSPATDDKDYETYIVHIEPKG